MSTNTGSGFCTALALLKAGKTARRAAWSADAFIWLMPAAEVKAEWCREPQLKQTALDRGGVVHCTAAIRRASRRGVQTGWLPSVEDLLATDWEAVFDGDPGTVAGTVAAFARLVDGTVLPGQELPDELPQSTAT